MHSIKDIRQNPELFKNGLSKRFVDVDLKKILSLDEIWWLVTPQNPLKISKPAKNIRQT